MASSCRQTPAFRAGESSLPKVWGEQLEALIKRQQVMVLTNKERDDSIYAPNNKLCSVMFHQERRDDIDRYEGPYPPDNFTS
jgi:hypothetical protein